MEDVHLQGKKKSYTRLHRILFQLLGFWETSVLIPMAATQFRAPPPTNKGSSFPASMLAFVVICFRDAGHTNRDEAESQRSLHCLSLMSTNVEYFFKHELENDYLYPGIFHVFIWILRWFFSSSVEKNRRDFDEDCVTAEDHFWWWRHGHTLILPMHKHRFPSSNVFNFFLQSVQSLQGRGLSPPRLCLFLVFLFQKICYEWDIFPNFFFSTLLWYT